MSTGNVYQRFTPAQRLEHLLLVVSFTVLAVTGLPQKFPANDVGAWLIGRMGGIEAVRVIHRFAATLLMLGAVYHLGATGYRLFVRHVRLTMLPTPQDALDGLKAFGYNLGMSDKRPQMGRYTFEEKLEYWSLIWGTLVMVITGFMMWNPIATARFLPGQVIPAAKAAHGGEALLAVLSILVWHMYGVHIRRFNKSMWTGKIGEADMLHEHPLELADIKAGHAERRVDPVALARRRRVFFPVMALISAVLVGTVYYFITFEHTAIDTIPARERVVVYVPRTPTPFPTLPPTPTSAPVAALTWDAFAGPLFKQSCTACHGVVGGLSLESYADALKGAKSGPVILPGDADGSPLVVVQSSGSHPGQLGGDQLALVREWIDAGAPEK